MKATQVGLTLIELMIALLLGLILSLAAVQLLLTNQRTFSLQDAVTSLNEDGQMVLRYLAADIRNAGRAGQIEGFVDPVVTTLAMEGEDGESVSFAAADGGNGSNDQLSVRYLGTSACQGADLTNGGTDPEGQIMVNRYYVEDGSLWCSSLRQVGLGSGTYEALSPNAVELISGVESFQVLYGLDADAPNGEVETTQFVTANDLNAGDSVVAIRIGLLLRSSETNLPVPEGSQKLDVLDQSITTSDDRAIRRVFSTTAQVRNVFWEGI